jgi:hypothetical protein
MFHPVRLITIASTILCAAALMIPITSAQASSWVVYNQNPDGNAVVLGENCSGNVPPDGYTGWTGTNVHYVSSGGWTGNRCDGAGQYTPTTTTETADAYWDFAATNPCSADSCDFPTVCKIWVYIATLDAGDYHARYDFYYSHNTPGNGRMIWEAWPGGTVDQEDNSGWAFIGEATLPASSDGGYLTVKMGNEDPANPGWDAYAGAVAADCVLQ